MKQERNIKEDNFVKITSVEGIAEAEQLLRTLKQHSIEGYRQGGILNAYFGIPNAKEDIFVREIDMEKAYNILASFEPIKVSNNCNSKYLVRTRRIVSWILLVGILLVLAVSLYTAVF